MKYEVIGWTSCANDMYPEHETITASVDAAIIKEIRKHNYFFGGDAHEYYCPVLNDGTYVSYSWRGWGRIMALAYEMEGEHSYMFGYMDMNIKSDALNYPEGIPEDERIVPKESLTETFVMHLTDDMFEKVRAGTKTVEIRLFDEKRKQVDIGDYIEFRKASDENERIIRRVADFDIWESFERAFDLDFYDKKKTDKRLRYSAEQLGAPANSDLQSIVEGMYKYYTKEHEEEHGVIAFYLEEPKPSCSICLSLLLYSQESKGLLEKKLSDTGIGSEEYTRIMENYYDEGLLEDDLTVISEDIVRRNRSFLFGNYDEYDVDVNVMLRKMLKDFFGKEQRLKEITEKFSKVITLEIFAVIVKDSEEQKQILSLDKDIVEFLHKSGIELKIGYRVV